MSLNLYSSAREVWPEQTWGRAAADRVVQILLWAGLLKLGLLTGALLAAGARYVVW